MAEDNATLSMFYKNWQNYHQNLRAAVAPLTDDQLSLRAAPGLRSLGELIAHVIGCRAGWFNDFMGEGGEEIAALSLWDITDAPPRTVAELLHGLDTTWALMTDRLARWDSGAMQHTFPQDWRGDHYDLSRAWVIWHILEHDLHHGGEISLTLGAHGLQAPDI